MKSAPRMLLTILALTALSAGAWSQTTNSTTATPAKPAQKKAVAKKAAPPAVTAADVQSLKDALAAQQQQIQKLSNLIESRDQKIDQLEQNLDKSQTVAVQAQTKADTAVHQTAAEEQAVLALKGDVADLKTIATTPGPNGPVLKNTVWALQDPSPMGTDQQIYNKDMELSLIHI